MRRPDAQGIEVLKALVGFTLVSGIGLGIDFCLFLAFVHAGFDVAGSNFVSAACAVTFVYFASVSRVFSYRGRFLLPLFLVYLAYQVVAVLLASLAVKMIVRLGAAPVLAKIMILPFTFGANFLFMSLLTRRRAVVAEGS